MNVRSQTMRMLLTAMTAVKLEWQSLDRERGMLIDPDAPVVVQCGDFGYEISSIGGDGDIDGFVIMLKAEPVCEWRGLECIKL